MTAPGAVFGHLTVLELFTGAEVDRPSHGTQVRVRCVCGKRRLYPLRRLVNGDLKSCGCLNPVRRRTVAYWPTDAAWGVR